MAGHVWMVPNSIAIMLDVSALRKLGLANDACENMLTLQIHNSKLQNTIEALVTYLGSTMAQVNDLEKKVGKLERQKQGPELPKDLPEKLEKMQKAVEDHDAVLSIVQETVSAHATLHSQSEATLSALQGKYERCQTATLLDPN